MAPARTPDEIRQSIEVNRQELGGAIERLRGEVVQLADWRAQLRPRLQQLAIGAGVTGFVLGGGIAGLGGIVFGRSR